MITSENCWLKDSCPKNKRGECENSSFCIKLFKLNTLYDQALLSLSQRKHTDLYLDNDNSDKEVFTTLSSIEKNIEQFVSKGENIFIHSLTTGNGKTAWAIRLIQSYFNCIWYKSDLSCKALFINVPKFLLALKESTTKPSDYVNHIKENIENADIVVWDEIGTKTATEYEHEHLLSLINNRIDNGKTNIYTSNLSSANLREKLGERLYSRIVNYSIDLEFKGRDKRYIARKQDIE